MSYEEEKATNHNMLDVICGINLRVFFTPLSPFHR